MSEAPSVTKTPPYARWVLVVLTATYTLNFVDRQILSVLAEEVKRSLDLSDSDLGFLYGTAFGVFYTLFGIPLGRLADNWRRVRLMTIGLTLWSFATVLSGFSRSGVELTAARIGVGVGEATASPCAYSLLSDWFPRASRATAIAIYSSGVFLGSGLSLFLGGSVVQQWNAAFPDGGPFGVVGWQAAFLVVGAPGLALAVVVGGLREPVRGRSDGVISPVSPTPFRDFAGELLTVIPPLTIIGAGLRDLKALLLNVIAAAVAAAGATLLIRITGDVAQWSAVALGAYAVFSWAAALRTRDAPAFRLIWGSATFLCVVVGYGLVGFSAYAATFWSAPYAIRVLGAAPQTAGLFIGGAGAVGGFLGIILGGRIADHLRRTRPSGRIAVALVGSGLALIPYAVAFNTRDVMLFYALQLPMTALSSSALGAAGATLQDLVLPRMRGTATATFFVGTTLLGLALGPYIAGRVSTLTGDLGLGILSLLAVAPVSLGCLAYAWRRLPQAEASVFERAVAAGEIVVRSPADGRS